MPTAGHCLLRALSTGEGEKEGEGAALRSFSSGNENRKKNDLGGNGGGATNVDMGAVAMSALSDTGLEVRAFVDALARIQMHHRPSAGACRCYWEWEWEWD